MSNVVRLANAAQRTLGSMFPGFFPSAKHNHYRDFGYPETLDFKQLYDMYLRNGIAHAGVTKTIDKTWQDQPFLLDHERDGSAGGAKVETEVEKQIRLRFEKLRVWQHLAEADTRGFFSRTYTESEQKVLTEVKGIKWTVTGKTSGVYSSRPSSTLIDAMFWPYIIDADADGFMLLSVGRSSCL